MVLGLLTRGFGKVECIKLPEVDKGMYLEWFQTKK